MHILNLLNFQDVLHKFQRLEMAVAQAESLNTVFGESVKYAYKVIHTGRVYVVFIILYLIIAFPERGGLKDTHSLADGLLSLPEFMLLEVGVS